MKKQEVEEVRYAPCVGVCKSEGRVSEQRLMMKLSTYVEGPCPTIDLFYGGENEKGQWWGRRKGG